MSAPANQKPKFIFYSDCVPKHVINIRTLRRNESCGKLYEVSNDSLLYPPFAIERNWAACSLGQIINSSYSASVWVVMERNGDTNWWSGHQIFIKSFGMQWLRQFHAILCNKILLDIMWQKCGAGYVISVAPMISRRWMLISMMADVATVRMEHVPTIYRIPRIRWEKNEGYRTLIETNTTVHFTFKINLILLSDGSLGILYSHGDCIVQSLKVFEHSGKHLLRHKISEEIWDNVQEATNAFTTVRRGDGKKERGMG